MGFRIRQDAKDWFKHIRKNDAFSLEFDIYYFCFMVGLSCKIREEIPTSRTSEFIDYFPGNYKKSGRIIVALLIKTELERQRINLTEKKSVNDLIRNLVSPNSPGYLSDEGYRLLDSYSHGGFEKIREWFGDEQPRSIELFLPRLKQELARHLNKIARSK